MKCLAFLNAEKQITLYYIFSQNSNTRCQLAKTNNLKLESNNFICQVDSLFFITLLWRCPILFPFTSLTYPSWQCSLIQATERTVNLWTTACTKIPVFLFMCDLHVTVNFYRAVCRLTDDEFLHRTEKFISFSLRNICAIAQQYICTNIEFLTENK